MNESDLWKNIKKLYPAAERVENSIKVGTPDVFFPTKHGWFWMELKILHGDHFYQERYQAGLLVRIERELGIRHMPIYVVWDPKPDNYYVYRGSAILSLPKEPYKDKIKLTHDKQKPPCGLVSLPGKIAFYTE